jgi:hypothetical protein
MPAPSLPHDWTNVPVLRLSLDQYQHPCYERQYPQHDALLREAGIEYGKQTGQDQL